MLGLGLYAQHCLLTRINHPTNGVRCVYEHFRIDCDRMDHQLRVLEVLTAFQKWRIHWIDKWFVFCQFDQLSSLSTILQCLNAKNCFFYREGWKSLVELFAESFIFFLLSVFWVRFFYPISLFTEISVCTWVLALSLLLHSEHDQRISGSGRRQVQKFDRQRPKKGFFFHLLFTLAHLWYTWFCRDFEENLSLLNCLTIFLTCK